MGRYERYNAPAISPEEQKILGAKRVFVAGCGGLGGYVVEYLGRIGVGHLTIADGDVFSASNLNRQLLSTEKTLGKPKPLCAKERLEQINPLVSVTPVCQNIDRENAGALLDGHDVAVDALDNGTARKILAQAANDAGIPLVSGAISGWLGRVFIVFRETTPDSYGTENPVAERGIWVLQLPQLPLWRRRKPLSCCLAARVF